MHRIRTIATWALLLASGIACANPPEKPERIVSINLCADQLLLLLADPEQISSLTHLSHEKGASYFLQKALSYPTNKGLAEEVLPYRPDLVIAGEYGGVHTVSLLQKLGIRVDKIAIADDMEAVLANIRHVAKLVGHPERGELVVSGMQQRLKDIPPPAADAPIAAVYDPNGYTVGAGTLRGRAMSLAGWRNAGELLGISSYGSLSLEAIVRMKPDALIESPYTLGTHSRAEALSRHPALRGGTLNPRIINIPSSMTICDGPWIMDVIEQLRSERLALQTDRKQN